MQLSPVILSIGGFLLSLMSYNIYITISLLITYIYCKNNALALFLTFREIMLCNVKVLRLLSFVVVSSYGTFPLSDTPNPSNRNFVLFI